MKKTILAAIFFAAASITFTSCKWFSSNKTAPSIVGTWTIDSLYSTSKDTNQLGLLLYAIAKKSSDSTLIQFNADSTFEEPPYKRSVPLKYYVKEKELFIQEDSAFVPYQLSFKNDSSASLVSKDSLVYLLKRK